MIAAAVNGRRRTLAIAAVAAALVVAYVVLWSRVDATQQLRSDFVGVYQGAMVLRLDGGAHLYDLASGLSSASALGVLPSVSGVFFVDAPPAAALMVPFTLLDVHTAWLAWSFLQLLAVIAAVAITARSAPWPRRDPMLQTAAALLGAAGVWTFILLVQAQWTGFFALGIAGGYALWRRGHLASGTAVALLPLLAVKPNLAVGLAAFLLAWGNRRVLMTAIACAAACAVASLAVAGPHGASAFLPAVLHDAQRWPSSSMNGFAGLAASVLGTGTVATAVGFAGSALAVALAFVLGRAARRRAGALEAALAGAVCLSLLASPHLYPHDLDLLAPAVVLGLVAASRIDLARGSTIPGAASATVAALWLAMSAAGFEQLGVTVSAFPGRLVPWFLIAFAALAFAGVRRVAAQLTPAPAWSGHRPTPAPAAPGGSPVSARTPAGTTPRAPDAARGW